MSTINERWNDYRERVIPKDAGEIQLKETRRAFYAGTISTLEAVLALKEESDEKAIAWLHATEDECLAFAFHIQEGKA
jgi:hypothetical protein